MRQRASRDGADPRPRILAATTAPRRWSPATGRSWRRRWSGRTRRTGRSAGWSPKSPPAPMSKSCPALIRQVLDEAERRRRRRRRHRRDRRPGPDRRGDGRAARRQGPRACRRQAADRGQSSRRPCAVARGWSIRRSTFPICCCSPAAAIARLLEVRGVGDYRRARDDHRRCRRRGVRQGRQAARPRLSRRPGDRGAGRRRAMPRRCRCRARSWVRRSRISPSPDSRARSSARSVSGAHRPEDIAASFQQAVVDCFVDRTRLALRGSSDAPTLVVAGGVAANRAVRVRAGGACRAREGAAFSVPPAGCAPTMRR